MRAPGRVSQRAFAIIVLSTIVHRASRRCGSSRPRHLRASRGAIGFSIRASARRWGAARGLIDADLGGGVIKQRVARPGRGRSGGYRVLLAYRAGTRSVFVFGFAKSERANIDDAELATLRDIAAAWLAADARALAQAIEHGLLQEVRYGEEEES
jgi:hypothetical protein